MGTFGALLEYGCEERVTEHSSLGLTMVVGTTGVTCRLKLSRSSQTYLFPFHLSDEVMLQPVFYGTVVPLLGWLTVKKLILEPLESGSYFVLYFMCLKNHIEQPRLYDQFSKFFIFLVPPSEGGWGENCK